MRIAFISASRVPSRAANSIEVMKVCQAFIDLGYEARIWVPGPRPEIEWPELAEFYGIRDHFAIHWLWSIKKLRRYDFCFRAVMRARRWGADVYYIWPFQAAAFASRLGFPTLLEVHDRPQGHFGPWLFRQFLAGKGARRILPITDALRLWLERAYRVSLEPPFTIISPSGVDLERYENLPEPEVARERLGLCASFTVGYTGHLYPGRGLDLMLELARRYPSMNFLWAGGEPPAVERWRQRVAIAGVHNLKLLGFVPNEDLPLVQSACEILLLPHERRVTASSGGDIAEFTSPMKLFEYMAAGRAIITSDLPVLQEVLNPSNAVFASTGNVDAWDKVLQNLVANPSRREALGAKARADVEQYTWRERARKSIVGLEAERG